LTSGNVGRFQGSGVVLVLGFAIRVCRRAEGFMGSLGERSQFGLQNGDDLIEDFFFIHGGGACLLLLPLEVIKSNQMRL
jgi:hypothetical protein